MNMSLVKCKHSFGNTKYRYNDPITGEKVEIALKKGVMCFVDEEVAKAFPDNFKIQAEPKAEKLDPVDEGDEGEKDAPVASDTPPDAENPPLDAENDPDESEKAEIDLKRQIMNFIDKSELDEYAKTLGVELDGRKSLKKMKSVLIKELEL
jgi:hypothetical protein